MKILAYLLLTLAGLPAFAADAFDPNDWSHKSKVELDTSATGVEIKGAVNQAPLALRLHTGNFTFADAKPDGADLRVMAADGKTPLRFHVETWDVANELAVLWVQLPALAPSAQSDAFWLYWGNADATAAGDAKGSYDATQSLVLHFSEKTAPQDSTANANHPREAVAAFGAVGPLGGAATFDGNGRITVPSSPSLKLIAANGLTFTAWVKPADIQSGTLFEQREGGGAITIALDTGALTVAAGGKAAVRGATPLQANIWQHVAVTLGAGKATIYVNGAVAGSGDLAVTDMGGDVTIGAAYRGDLDEVTAASTARSDDYIKTIYASQQPDGLLLAFAEEGEESGGEVSYMNILLGAVTIDGWVVIGILGIMAVISFWVMVTKTQFLLASQKGNDEFSERFRKSSAALLIPGSPEARSLENPTGVLNKSPIFRLYQTGAYEMGHRFETQQQAGEEHNLSGAALDAIRASVDATMVRETHRLNAQMVLLTIAISGGPFLGLLGTVVGVMITFAAIAAAGDVNVNSIAPGIAAALVATVAGLAVAIPALFGYNWLASKIKNITTDMHVFADEFVTKAAELHSK